jgi:predicted membrane protein
MGNDLPPPNWIVFLIITVIFIVTALMANLEEALGYSVTFGVFAAVIQTKWSSRHRRYFWIVIAVFALIHVIVLSAVRIPALPHGSVAMPFALVDGFIIYGFLNWLERRIQNRSSEDNANDR